MMSEKASAAAQQPEPAANAPPPPPSAAAATAKATGHIELKSKKLHPMRMLPSATVGELEEKIEATVRLAASSYSVTSTLTISRDFALTADAESSPVVLDGGSARRMMTPCAVAPSVASSQPLRKLLPAGSCLKLLPLCFLLMVSLAPTTAASGASTAAGATSALSSGPTLASAAGVVARGPALTPWGIDLGSAGLGGRVSDRWCGTSLRSTDDLGTSLERVEITCEPSFSSSCKVDDARSIKTGVNASLTTLDATSHVTSAGVAYRKEVREPAAREPLLHARVNASLAPHHPDAALLLSAPSPLPRPFCPGCPCNHNQAACGHERKLLNARGCACSHVTMGVVKHPWHPCRHLDASLRPHGIHPRLGVRQFAKRRVVCNAL